MWEMTAAHIYKGDEYQPEIKASAKDEEDIVLTDEEKKKQEVYVHHRKELNPLTSEEELVKSFKSLVIAHREQKPAAEFKNSFRSKAIRADVAKLIQGFDVLNSHEDIKRFLMELIDAHRALNENPTPAVVNSPHIARRAQTLAYLTDDNWPLLGVINSSSN